MPSPLGLRLVSAPAPRGAWRLTMVALPLLAMPQAALADDASGDAALSPIVVNGETYRIDEPASTKTGTLLLDTPQSIAVLQREQLDDQAVEQLGDALRYVPGVTLGQGEGHRDQIVLRGQSSTADFFLDGMRDDAQYYRPLYNVERIEVLKGANALLFGRGGGGGIVNRVSKTADSATTRLSASAGVDSWGAWSAAADANQPLGSAAAIRLNATYEEFANHRDLYSGSFLGLAPTISTALGETGTLTLAYEYDRDRRVTDRGVPSLGGSPIRGYDRTFFGSAELNRSSVDAHIARARYDRELGGGLTLSLSGLYAHYDKYYGNLLPSSATATTVTLTGYASSTVRDNWIGQANLVWKGSTGAIGHTLLAGIEGGDQTTGSDRRTALFGTVTSATVSLARTLTLPTAHWSGIERQTSAKARTWSAYVQDQIELAPYLQLIAGIRFDRFDIAATNLLTSAQTARADSMWSPRFGLILKPQANISLYASYARSFLPQSGDQFTTLDASYQTLEPEAFRNLEIGAKWDIAPALSFSAALFQVDRNNTRANDPLTGNPVLTGSSRVRGFEASLAGKITPDWQISLGYTHQSGEIRSTTTAAPAGRKLDKLPSDQFAAWTRYDLTSRLGLGLGLVHQSSQFATISNAVRLPGFTRIDAALFYDLSDAVAIQLNIENLTDTNYFASAHTDNNIATGEPINARLTLRMRF
ncbi:MAG: TonB-dependent siderophore receptor [Novosphingobium sp.]|uniref:TonB-dependent receptor n=1 Tax=Novosphingobium sp. TaxID=1874826 RepID=UPI002618DE67|nr:TonB-dependent siderophore receptor [Novosphingobium sp.]MCP5385886.1 TonB-dependent siderophore receptor [Novosphingobium sp.]MCP5396359.1 TonB-dependent siderophore receptor [Sphingomonadaceae bacterium]